MRPSSTALGALLVIAGSAAFGTVGIAVQGALAAGFALPAFLAARYALASSASALTAASAERAHRTRPGRVHLAALGLGVVTIAQSACFFLALERIDVALVLALHFTFPALVLGLESALARRLPARREAIACAIALGGVLLVVLAGGAGGADPVGLALAAGSGLVYAFVVMASARILRRLPPATTTAWQLGGLASAWLVVCVVLGIPLGLPGGHALVQLVLIAIGCTSVPMLLLSAGTRLVGPVTASTLATVEPLVGAGLAAVVLGQEPAPLALVGGALIVVAAVLASGPALPAAPMRRAVRVASPARRLGSGTVVVPGARREVVARTAPRDHRGESRAR